MHVTSPLGPEHGLFCNHHPQRPLFSFSSSSFPFFPLHIPSTSMTATSFLPILQAYVLLRIHLFRNNHTAMLPCVNRKMHLVYPYLVQHQIPRLTTPTRSSPTRPSRHCTSRRHAFSPPNSMSYFSPPHMPTMPLPHKPCVLQVLAGNLACPSRSPTSCLASFVVPTSNGNWHLLAA